MIDDKMKPKEFSDAIADPARFLACSAGEWEAAIGYATFTKLLARLACDLEEMGALDGVPTGPRRHLQWARLAWDAQQRANLWDMDRIGYALRGIDTPIVLLKGVAYSLANLPPARGRLFTDIDLMVRRETLRDVESALGAQGWVTQKTNAYDDRYYRAWMHEIPPLVHTSRGSVLDVHHTILPPTSRTPIDANKLLAAAIPIDRRRNLYVLAPPDMVLHSILHLVQGGEFEAALRDLLDLSDLLTAFGDNPDFWHALRQRASELRVSRQLCYGVAACRDIFGTRIPEDFLPEINRWLAFPGTMAFSLLAIEKAILPDAPRSRSMSTGLLRYYLYVRSHYERMPLHLLIPHLLRKSVRRRDSAK